MKSPNQPLVYIISINWNGYWDTLDFLNSLYKISYSNYKVVVVDNGSRKQEANKIKAKFPKIRLVKNKNNLGFCGANNQGIKIALNDKKTKYIFLLNNDTIIDKFCLTNLVLFAEKNNYKGILTPKILYHNTNTIWAMGGKLSFLTSIPRMINQGKRSSNYNQVITPTYAPGSGFFIDRETIKRVGKFRPIYFAYYEDTDLSFRVKKLGYSIRVIPKSVVWHKVSKSTKNKSSFRIGPTQSYLLARNGLVFASLNLKGVSRFSYLLSQYIIKLPLYLTVKADSIKSGLYYLLGIVDGSLYLINQKHNRIHIQM